MLKIKKGDKVIVLTGKFKGHIARVIKNTPKLNRCIVKGINILKKYVNSRSTIIKKEFYIHRSNISVIDPKLNVPTKISFGLDKYNKKIRICKKSKINIIN